MVPLNIPNALTMLRIVAVPVLVVALLGEIPNGDLWAGIVFGVAAFTDGLDGYIARRKGDVTTFGKLMDPLADKLLIVAALISLVSLNRLAAWVAMVIIARELAVTGLRAVAVERGVVISASWMGKLKTLLQVVAIFALILLLFAAQFFLGGGPRRRGRVYGPFGSHGVGGGIWPTGGGGWSGGGGGSSGGFSGGGGSFGGGGASGDW